MCIRDRYWLYEHTDGANWKLNTNWAPHLDPCYLVSRWVGVGAIDPCDRWRDGPDCAFGRITAVYLGNNGLSGNITGWSGLGELHNLTMLDLSWNNLTGALPTQLGQLVDLEILCVSPLAVARRCPRARPCAREPARHW